MTNEQLGVLLFHIGRQINQQTCKLEPNVKEDELIELRAIADVLLTQARQLGVPSIP